MIMFPIYVGTISGRKSVRKRECSVRRPYSFPLSEFEDLPLVDEVYFCTLPIKTDDFSRQIISANDVLEYPL